MAASNRSGQYALIGAVAVVVKNIPDFALVVGNPARTIIWMCVCGNRLIFTDEGEIGTSRVCSQTYRKVDQGVSLK